MSLLVLLLAAFSLAHGYYFPQHSPPAPFQRHPYYQRHPPFFRPPPAFAAASFSAASSASFYGRQPLHYSAGAAAAKPVVAKVELVAGGDREEENRVEGTHQNYGNKMIFFVG